MVMQLIVRNLNDEVVRQLKMRAAQNGRSAEAEHRAILAEVLLPDRRPPLIDFLLTMPDVGDDEDFERPRDLGREIDL